MNQSQCQCNECVEARVFVEALTECADCGAKPARLRQIPGDADGGFGDVDHKRVLCSTCAHEIGLEP